MGRLRARTVCTALGFASLSVAEACTYDFGRFDVGSAEGGTSSGGGSARGGSEGTAGRASGAGAGGSPRGGASGGERAAGGEATGGSPPEQTGGNPSGGDGAAGGEVTGGSPPVPTGGNPSGGDGAAGGVLTGGSSSGATGGGGVGGGVTGGGPSGGNDATGGEVVGGEGPATGGQAGSTGIGGTGGGPCDAEHKLCGEQCVVLDDPDWGCGSVECDPCTIPNGTPTCTGGACAVDGCDLDHLDCDGEADNGCETGRGSFSNEHCGGCDNSCATLGYSDGFVCQNGSCMCTSPAQCSSHNGTFACGDGVCECEGTVCQPGETCSRKVASNWLCGCNGGAECSSGSTCCINPPGCRNLLVDEQNCGACGWHCPDDMSCVDGVCE